MELNRIFRPLSAEAFRNDPEYSERLPSPALSPYVHCFWGSMTMHPVNTSGGLVVPDLCMDLIFTLNYTRNSIRSAFCALDDCAHFTGENHSGDLCATFGIRFYAWSAACFADESLQNTMRNAYNPSAFFRKICREIEPRLFDLPTIESRIAFAESALSKYIRPEKMNADLCNAMHAMIQSCGRTKIADCASSIGLSERQLERRFLQNTGASPKLINQLVRHQLIYRDLAEGRFHALDAVERYGYADQSHLLRDFKKFHLLSLREEAERLRNKNVGFFL